MTNFFIKKNNTSFFLVLSFLLFQLGWQEKNSSAPSAPVIYAATGIGLSISTNGGLSFVNKTTTDGLGNNQVYSVSVSGAGI